MPRSTTPHEDDQFEEELAENMLSGLDATFVLIWVASNFKPEDIFDDDDLNEWASANGFIREE